MYLRTFLAALAALFIISGCSSTSPVPADETSAAPEAVQAPAPVPGGTLENAASVCGLDGVDGVELNASGTTLTIDTKGPKEASGADIAGVSCVLKTLEVPKVIQSMMKLTTSTAEPKDASWAGRDFAWNYDPETHFQITISQP